MITMDKKYRTRDGRDVRLVSDKGPFDYPFVGVITYKDGVEGIFCWPASGAVSADENRTDLIEVVPDRVTYSPIFAACRVGVSFGSPEDARVNGHRISTDASLFVAILRTTIRNGGINGPSDVTVEVLPVDYSEPTP